MPGELHELSVAIGSLQADVRTLSRTVRDNQEASSEEHRKVHDIVVATSEAVRNLAAKVAEMKPNNDAVPDLKNKVSEMKPLTDDYRERRAEDRGKQKLMHLLYVAFGGIAGALTTWVMSLFSIKPHP